MISPPEPAAHATSALGNVRGRAVTASAPADIPRGLRCETAALMDLTDRYAPPTWACKSTWRSHTWRGSPSGPPATAGLPPRTSESPDIFVGGRRYEASLAERRYKAVDPDNRVVARTLERDWEERLRALESLEDAHGRARRTRKVELSETDRTEILALASNLPKVWTAPSTTHVQRKQMLRILVQVTTLTPVEVPKRATRVQIQWRTGAVTEVTVERPRYAAGRTTPEQIVDQIQQLVREGYSDAEIAIRLNDTDHKTAFGRALTCQSVRGVRKRRGISNPYKPGAGRRIPTQRPDGLVSVRALAERAGVSEQRVRGWARSGWITPAEGGDGSRRPLWFRLDDELERALDALAKGRRRSQRTP